MSKHLSIPECEVCTHHSACLVLDSRVLCQVPAVISQDDLKALQEKKPKCEADPEHGLGDYGWVAGEGEVHPLCKPCWNEHRSGQAWDEVGVFWA